MQYEGRALLPRNDYETKIFSFVEPVSIRTVLACVVKTCLVAEKYSGFSLVSQPETAPDIKVEPVTTDRYGRTVGIVHVDGNSLSEELVKSGFDWVYDRYCKKDMCDKWKQLEEAARQSKKGLWLQDNPVAPWAYRRKGKK
jgi:hypothetical protein